MPEDASLDAFTSSETGDPSEDADAESSTETAEADPETPDFDVDPARSTYEWSPDGGECADCGTSAERRWRRDGQRDGELVCADCKEW